MNRRQMLASAAASAALPLFPRYLLAAEPQPPKNLLVVFTANGTIYPNWRPQGTETSWTPSRILEPLASWKHELIVLDRLDKKTSGPGDGHMKGVTVSLTAAELLPGTMKCGGVTPCAGWANGVSVDQFLAGKVGATTRFPSLELAVGTRRDVANNRSRWSYRGPEQPLPPEVDPYKVHDRLFAGLLPADADEAARRAWQAKVERLRAQRRSVLDLVKTNLTGLRARVGREGRTRLDGHADAVRELERELDRDLQGPDPTGVCQAPPLGAAFDPVANDNYPRAGKAHMDLAVMALACGQTRIATLMWDMGVSQKRFTWLGLERGHHDMSHDGDSNTASREALTRIDTWYAQQMAYLVDHLAKVPAADGRTLLDHTLVVWMNEFGVGNRHSPVNTPFVLAGGRAGGIRPGRLVDCRNDSHAKLLVSMCHFMGVPVPGFGDPKLGGTGPLPGLV